MHKIYTKTLLLAAIIFSSFYVQAQSVDVEVEPDIKPVTAILMLQNNEAIANTMIDINPENDRDSAGIKVEDGETVSSSENSNYVIGLTQENETEEEGQDKIDNTADLSASLVDEIKAFPNPATDFLNLQFTSRGIYEVYIFNLVGSLEQQHYVDNEVDYQMDVTELQTGVYIVQVVANGEMNSIRIKIAR